MEEAGRFFWSFSSISRFEMKQVELKVQTRTELGRGPAGRARRAGKIPAVIYGTHGTRPLTVDAHEWTRLWKEMKGRTALIELHTEGAESTWSIVQDFQRNPLSDKFEHIDFKEIERGKEMTASIAVVTKGSSVGVRMEGGVITISLQEIEVRCLPRHLPEEIVVDVTEMKVGDSRHIADLTPPEGVTYLDDEDVVVVACVGKSSLEDEVGDGEAEEAEVVATAQKSEG